MSLIRKHGAVLQAWACLDLVLLGNEFSTGMSLVHITRLVNDGPIMSNGHANSPSIIRLRSAVAVADNDTGGQPLTSR